MPIKLNFKRTHRYNVSAKDLYVIRIYTLDGTCVEYTVSTTTTGRDALEYVAQRLDIEDTCFFGFKYEGWSGEARWLFLNKSVKKQLDKHARQHALTLTVMLFIDNPQFISDSQLRRFFYLQLRQDVATGSLPVTLKLGIKLCAYSLQADFGDFVDVDTALSNWRERSSLSEGTFCGAFDLSTTEYVDDILWGYLHLQGVSQDNAVWYFLDEIRHIPRYGVRTFRGMTCRNEPAELGVSRNGITITTLEPQQRTTANLKWEHIKDLTYSRKTFTIQLLKKNKAVHFLFEDTENARYLWQFCIQMHSSYIEYWTRVKSAPQQPAIQVSEPPDILRGTELRCLSPESPMISDALHEENNSPLVKQGSNSIPSDPVVVRDLSNNVNAVVTVHGLSCTTEFSRTNEHHTFKIDPNKFITGPINVADPATGVSLASNEHFLSSSAPSEPRHQDPKGLTLLNALQDNNGPASSALGGGDSEAGTLIGQWSLRSAADTLDSQMVNQGCVTCLPGRECLRPAAGWFQPRAGLTTHGPNWTASGERHEKVDRKAINLNQTDHEVQAPDGRSTRSPGGDNQIYVTHHRHRHQNNRQEQLSGSPFEKDQEQRPHRTHQPKRQRQVQEKMPSLIHRTGVPMGGVNVIIDGAPSSPSSLASSDTSSGHRIASSRASFSSTSSSCCSTRMKKTSNSLCGAVSSRAAHSTPGHNADSCSSSSSSTSSINSTAAVGCTGADPTVQVESDDGGKKTYSGFTAALCSVAHNIAFKPSSKASSRHTGPITTASSTPIGSSTLNTGRKLWNELIQSNHGGLRPLLSGFSQHHYRPQVQLKRQQAAADATLQEQCLSLGRVFPEGVGTLDNGRSRKGKYGPKDANGTGGINNSNSGTVSNVGGSNPLHDFQRWISAARQRLPAVWTNTGTNRGMMLQISAPLPSSPSGTGQQIDADKADLNATANLESRSPRYAIPIRPHELPVLDTNQPGRLARSSSEACARDLTGKCGVGYNNNPSSQFSAPQQQSPLYSDTVDRPTTEHIHESVAVTHAGPPTIHLYPPSPTQTSYSHHSVSLEGDSVHAKELWTYELRPVDSTSQTTQTDMLTDAQTGDFNSTRLSQTSQIQVAQNHAIRRASLENRFVTDEGSQNKMPLLQRQGAIKTPLHWRLMPQANSQTDGANQTATVLKVQENTNLSSVLFPATQNTFINATKIQSSPTMEPHELSGAILDESVLHHGIDLQHMNGEKVNVNRLLENLDSSSNGHLSAPPSTPSGRLHFVWNDLPAVSNGLPQSSTMSTANATVTPWKDKSSRNTGIISGVNLSTYLSRDQHLQKENSKQPISSVVSEHCDQQRPFSVTDAGKLRPSIPRSQDIQQMQEQGPRMDSVADPAAPPFSTALTTSSSSEHSSVQRPPSSGPIHLLTHSDIHQLLSLTNIRETELAHRLLVEYRQALLQQHSLHTNSVSTPNLTASQELQMFSSSTAAEDIEEVEVVHPDTENREVDKQTTSLKAQTQRTKHSEGRPKHAYNKADSSCCKTQPNPISVGQDESEAQVTRPRRRRRKEISSIDSPDYVNAAAFRGDRSGAGERPLSLASSTDMESNGTFRVLSSVDTRTSSVVCDSFGNLTAQGTSFGSGDGAGFDLIQGLQNYLANGSSNGVHATMIMSGTAGNNLGPRQSVNLSCDQLSQHRNLVDRNPVSNGTTRDLSGSQGQVDMTLGLSTGEPPPDLCLSSTYPNLCEEQHLGRHMEHSMFKQPKTLSDLSPRQRDPPARAHLVGEYENLEALSNEQLQRLRSVGQSPLSIGHTSAPREEIQTVSVLSPGTNQNESISTMGYSTTTSIPPSPSSDSVSSAGSMSSTISSSASSLGTSLSSDLSCTAGMASSARDPQDCGGTQGKQCTPTQEQESLKQLSSSITDQTEPRHNDMPSHTASTTIAHQQHKQGHHHHHRHHHQPSPLPEQSGKYSHVEERGNLAVALNKRRCSDQNCFSRKVLFLPDSLSSRRRLTHCPFTCHKHSTMIKSNSLRLNSTTQLAQSTANNKNINRTNGTNDHVVLNYGGSADKCEHGRPRLKARSFDPFSRDSCSSARCRIETSVCSHPIQSHEATSRSIQNCRGPSSHLHKAWQGTRGIHNKHPKPCLKTLPLSRVQSVGVRCPFHSEDNVAEALCYLSDDDRYRTDDATSVTLSATDSSASSYSFSTSSLDAQTEDVCNYYHHCYAPSCTPLACLFHEVERVKRGGSLDPGASIQRLPTAIQAKRISHPSTHRSSHRKRSTELHSFKSNPSSSSCAHPWSCVCYNLGIHDTLEAPRLSSKSGMYQSLEGARVNRPSRHGKTDQTSSPGTGMQARICKYAAHTTDLKDSVRRRNGNCKEIVGPVSPTQSHVCHGHGHHRHHRRHHHHNHHRHADTDSLAHKNITNVVSASSAQMALSKPPVAKRKSNELREATANDSANHTVPKCINTKVEDSSTNSALGETAQLSVPPTRPRDLQLTPRTLELSRRVGSSLNSSPGFSSSIASEELVFRQRNSPTGSSQHTDHTPPCTVSRIFIAEGGKGQTSLAESLIPRSPRVSPDLLTRPLSRSSSNDTENVRSLPSPNGPISLGKYAPSMIPSRARQSESCVQSHITQPYASIGVHARTKGHPVSLPSTSNSLLSNAISERRSILQVTQSHGSLPSPSAAVCTSSLLVNPLQSSNNSVGGMCSTEFSNLGQTDFGFMGSREHQQNKPVDHPLIQTGRSEIHQPQFMRSGSLEPDMDFPRRSVMKIPRQLNSSASTLIPLTRTSTPDGVRPSSRPTCGSSEKTTEKKMSSSRVAIDSAPAVNKPSVSSSLNVYEKKKKGSLPRPLLLTSRYSNSLAKRV